MNTEAQKGNETVPESEAQHLKKQFAKELRNLVHQTKGNRVITMQIEDLIKKYDPPAEAGK